MKIKRVGKSLAFAGALLGAGYLANPELTQAYRDQNTDRLRAVAAERFGSDYWKSSPAERYPPHRVAGPDGPDAYAAVRAKVEAQFASAPYPGQWIVNSYAAGAADRPDDAEAVFAWGVAAFEESRRHAARGVDFWAGRSKERGALAWLLARGSVRSAPGSREYARLRFLADDSSAGREGLIALGRGLLRAVPDDRRVRRKLAFHLGNGRDRASLGEAVRLGEGLLREDPRDLPSMSLMGYIFTTRWMAFHERADADAATRWYRAWLEGSQADASEKEAIERMIATWREPRA